MTSPAPHRAVCITPDIFPTSPAPHTGTVRCVLHQTYSRPLQPRIQAPCGVYYTRHIPDLSSPAYRHRVVCITPDIFPTSPAPHTGTVRCVLHQTYSRPLQPRIQAPCGVYYTRHIPDLSSPAYRHRAVCITPDIFPTSPAPHTGTVWCVLHQTYSRLLQPRIQAPCGVYYTRHIPDLSSPAYRHRAVCITPDIFPTSSAPHTGTVWCVLHQTYSRPLQPRIQAPCGVYYTRHIPDFSSPAYRHRAVCITPDIFPTSPAPHTGTVRCVSHQTYSRPLQPRIQAPCGVYYTRHIPDLSSPAYRHRVVCITPDIFPTSPAPHTGTVWCVLHQTYSRPLQPRIQAPCGVYYTRHIPDFSSPAYRHRAVCITPDIFPTSPAPHTGTVWCVLHQTYSRPLQPRIQAPCGVYHTRHIELSLIQQQRRSTEMIRCRLIY